MRTPIDDFVSFLVKRRNALGLTQRQLAEASGLNHGTLANIEARRVTKAPSIPTLEKLAIGLQVHVELLNSLAQGRCTEEQAFKSIDVASAMEALQKNTEKIIENVVSSYRLSKHGLGSAEEVSEWVENRLRDEIDRYYPPEYREDEMAAEYTFSHLFKAVYSRIDVPQNLGREEARGTVAGTSQFEVPSDAPEPPDSVEMETLRRISTLDFGSLDPRRDSQFWYEPRSVRRRILLHFDGLWHEFQDRLQRSTGTIEERG